MEKTPPDSSGGVFYEGENVIFETLLHALDIGAKVFNLSSITRTQTSVGQKPIPNSGDNYVGIY
jgi:hypothetical protein